MLSSNLRRTLLATSRASQRANTSTFTSNRQFSQSTFKMGVHNLQTKKEFDEAVEVKDTLLVLDCFATWCGPCKTIAPVVEKMSENYTSAKFYKLDVDQVPDVAQELGIRAMPTFMLFKNGNKISEVVGANPKALETAISDNY